MNAATHVLAERDGRRWVAGVVHAHTTMSDGKRTPEDLVAFAHGRGLGVVCITDRSRGHAPQGSPRGRG